MDRYLEEVTLHDKSERDGGLRVTVPFAFQAKPC